MQHKNKLYTTIVTAILAFSIMLAFSPMANAAGTINLDPAKQTAGSSVTVTGSGFAATAPVAIVMGTEVTVINEVHNIPAPTGTGPFTASTNHGSIKPGSFSFHCVVSSDSSVVESDYTDNGDGTLTSSSTYALNPFVDYVTGAFGRSTTSAWDGYTVVFTANYTYYTYSVTPVAGVTTSGSGAFSTSVTIPSAMPQGTTTVTAFDNKGNRGTATLNVDVIPEGFSIGFVVALSATAVVVGTHFLRKQPKTIVIPK
ncbi:MAG: hypothetical protein NWE93_11990 [Candidatus Bathyarchaeota archaeon]|nr:hypothetical protein [Candidatus Bathyarchaeota archaeon]